jgi:phosphohistidine phosphatase
MRVYVVRHAEAFERDRKRWPDDDLRPLTPAGIREFRDAAAGIGRVAARPGRVLVSPLRRAQQTAEILTDVAEWPRATATTALAPEEPVKHAFALLRAQARGRIALVGHEPHLTLLLAAAIAGSGSRAQLALKKGGAACLDFEGAVRPGRGTLAWLLAPKALRALGAQPPPFLELRFDRRGRSESG